jgi:hypothetical protein
MPDLVGAGGVLRKALYLHLIGAHVGVERRVRWTLAEGIDEHSRSSLPVRESVTPVRTPRRDHRKDEHPALAERFSISVRIALVDL